MDKLAGFLAGKRSYIVGAAGLVVIVLQVFGFVDSDVAGKALAALGFTGVITLRAAVK